MQSLLKENFEEDSKYFGKYQYDKKYKTTTEYSLDDNEVFYYVKDDTDKINKFNLRNYNIHFKFMLDN